MITLRLTDWAVLSGEDMATATGCGGGVGVGAGGVGVGAGGVTFLFKEGS